MKKTVFYIFLLLLTTAVKAELPEQESADKLQKNIEAAAEESNSTEQKAAEDAEPSGQVETAEAAEEPDYIIVKKHNPDNPCDRENDAYNYEKQWYDDTQVYINSRFCEPALWFDNFFANDRIFKEGVAGTYIRWRNEFIFDEEEGFSFDLGISASVELPGAENKLRLTFESDEDEDIRDIAPGNSEQSTNTLGLQLDVRENARSKLSVSVSLSPKVRLRYRYTYPVHEELILRFTQELQRKKEVNSARSLFDIERAFKPNYLFRSSTEGEVSNDYEGVDWLQAFVLYQRINKKTSLSYETSVNGITEPTTQAVNYRVGMRFRKNFHRKWLFYEIAPEMTWPITYDEERTTVEIERRSKWLLFFRLEVHFGNAHKRRYEDYN